VRYRIKMNWWEMGCCGEGLMVSLACVRELRVTQRRAKEWIEGGMERGVMNKVPQHKGQQRSIDCKC